MQDPRFYKEFTPAPHLARFIEAYWTLHRDSAFKPVRRYIYADGLAEMFVNLGTCIPLVDGKIPLKPGRLYYGGTMTATSYIDGLPDSHSASAPKPLSTSSVSTTWFHPAFATHKFVASAVFGKSAFAGGSPMVALGLLFHYYIAFILVLSIGIPLSLIAHKYFAPANVGELDSIQL